MSFFEQINAIQATSPWVTTATIQGTAAVVTATTAPANGLMQLCVVNTAAPAPTNGQSVGVQADYQGSLFVRPSRRSSVITNAIAITNTSTATTLLPAQAGDIFADLSELIVTVVPSSGTTCTVFNLTISDGTKNYVYDMVSGCTTLPGTLLNFIYDPPFPASVAATTWTAKLSTSSITAHLAASAVLQKAS